MPCYVDQIQKWPGGGRTFRDGSCHLIADTLDELHAMADRIGMKRAWFQPAPASAPHYDLVPSRRAKAVALGAIELNRADFVAVVRRLRAARIAWAEKRVADAKSEVLASFAEGENG